MSHIKLSAIRKAFMQAECERRRKWWTKVVVGYLLLLGWITLVYLMFKNF